MGSYSDWDEGDLSIPNPTDRGQRVPLRLLPSFKSPLSSPDRNQRPGAEAPRAEGGAAKVPQGELRGLQIRHRAFEQVSLGVPPPRVLPKTQQGGLKLPQNLKAGLKVEAKPNCVTWDCPKTQQPLGLEEWGSGLTQNTIVGVGVAPQPNNGA